MNIICEYDDCTGCAACFSACRHGAIKMIESADSFMHPIIDSEKCIDCKLCQSVCPSVKPVVKRNPQKCFMAFNTSDEQRLYSSSGGVFATIATYVLNMNGVVVGATYDKKMNVVHQCITLLNDLKKLQGSKYVQSCIGNIYKEVESFLKTGRFVYFVGTPCQVAGLLNYLNKNYTNLITSDFVCHGVPSNSLFKKQIDDINKNYKCKVVDFKFRSKRRFGWGYDIQIDSLTKNGTCIKFFNAELLPYFYGFWHNLTLRECCYSCKYATLERVSDITLSDYWMVKKFHPNIKTSKGVSFILANSDISEKIIYDIENDGSLFIMEDNINDAIKIQAHLSRPVKIPNLHRFFKNDIHNMEWLEIKKKYLSPPLTYKIKMKIRNIIKIIILYKLWK